MALVRLGVPLVVISFEADVGEGLRSRGVDDTAIYQRGSVAFRKVMRHAVTCFRDKRAGRYRRVVGIPMP